MIGVYLFSLDGLTLSSIDEADIDKVFEAIYALDAASSNVALDLTGDPIVGGRPNMFYVVLRSATTLTVGTDGGRALFDAALYESDYEVCQELDRLYAKLIG